MGRGSKLFRIKSMKKTQEWMVKNPRLKISVNFSKEWEFYNSRIDLKMYFGILSWFRSSCTVRSQFLIFKMGNKTAVLSTVQGTITFQLNFLYFSAGLMLSLWYLWNQCKVLAAVCRRGSYEPEHGATRLSIILMQLMQLRVYDPSSNKAMLSQRQ